jgi:hypothetical protein
LHSGLAFIKGEIDENACLFCFYSLALRLNGKSPKTGPCTNSQHIDI